MHLKNLENIDVFIEFYQIATRENFHPCDQASIYGNAFYSDGEVFTLGGNCRAAKKRVATDIGYVWDCVHAVWWVCLVLHSKIVSVGLVCCTL